LGQASSNISVSGSRRDPASTKLKQGAEGFAAASLGAILLAFEVVK
jgi:hypothetical protein